MTEVNRSSVWRLILHMFILRSAESAVVRCVDGWDYEREHNVRVRQRLLRSVFISPRDVPHVLRRQWQRMLLCVPDHKNPLERVLSRPQVHPRFRGIVHNVLQVWLRLCKYVTEDHKTCQKGQFPIDTLSENWINNISIGLDNIWKSGIWGCTSKYWENHL